MSAPCSPTARTATRAFLGLVDPQGATLQLGSVEARDGLRDGRRIREGHKCEATRSPRRPVDRQKDIRHVTDLSKQRVKLCLRRVKVEIADKDLCRNDVPP